MSPGLRALGPACLLAVLGAGLLPAAGQPKGDGPGPAPARQAAPAQTAPAPAKPSLAKPPPSPNPAPTPLPAPAAAAALTPGFSVKPSDIVLPADVPLGQYRRTFRPYPNWTLICDENLARRQKVCNVAQTILGPDGGPVLSWSLAANQGGEPLFIIRTPTGLGERGEIRLDVPDGGPPLAVPVSGCDARICLAYLPASPRLKAAVAKGLAVGVSYAAGTPAGAVSFRAPLDGLSAALGGL